MTKSDPRICVWQIASSPKSPCNLSLKWWQVSLLSWPGKQRRHKERRRDLEGLNSDFGGQRGFVSSHGDQLDKRVTKVVAWLTAASISIPKKIQRVFDFFFHCPSAMQTHPRREQTNRLRWLGKRNGERITYQTQIFIFISGHFSIAREEKFLFFKSAENFLPGQQKEVFNNGQKL